MTYAELKEMVVGLAFPARMARSMVPLRERHVLNGIIELQTKLPKLREKNSSIYTGDDNFVCGAIEVDSPEGLITKVEAFRADTPSDDIETECECLVPYILGEPASIEVLKSRWSINGGAIQEDDNGNPVNVLPVPLGVFAVSEGRLLAYPAPLTPWKLRVKWRGIRQTFSDDDEVEFTQSQITLLAAFVAWMGAVDDRCWQDEPRLRESYFLLRRDEYLRLRDEENPVNPHYDKREAAARASSCGTKNCDAEYAPS